MKFHPPHCQSLLLQAVINPVFVVVGGWVGQTLLLMQVLNVQYMSNDIPLVSIGKCYYWPFKLRNRSVRSSFSF